MSIVESILREELERLQEAQKSYQKEIKSLPKGSIQHKKISGKLYPYLVYRDGKKVSSRYLGNLAIDGLEQLKNHIERRRNHQEMLNRVLENISEIDRMLNARRRPR